VLLADLGFASPQVDNPERGFSFMRDGPLDMRLDPTAPIAAGELVNTMPEHDLADLIATYGEEPPAIARRIAQKVVQERKKGPIQATVRLAEIVRSAIPVARAESSHIHPATRTFQALRIAVNDEIGSLERLLDSIERAAVQIAAKKNTWLAPGARVGIIAFHSLEDRPVKQSFGRLVERGLAEPVTRKPVVAGDAEIAANPRARSAKLRVVRLAT
jgi:16S rRNA (cytosine1402-N4)-methyltransferase